ncbi:NAD(P)-binding protein [Sistotremastrum niveocremeum HHB9708]|uniref:NAD(P)-binding protein n=1 Tax=Sistotremastrum niveocremeum HHB9708 TaxID=1314777 RepID=A0A164YGH2_9AGAM|nr:NAD(P)-binding protein [Sistotremastrum niveocremeum HHB9708]
MTNVSQPTKLILVIGAAGAQGSAVVKALVASNPDGSPSPFSVRALTRNPESPQAKELAALNGVELFVGSYTDFPGVLKALEGCYGAFVNTDGFTEGEQSEIYSGIRIFELAKQIGTLKHYVWSGLDYAYKLSGYNPQHRCVHTDGKGRVTEFLKMQPSDTNGMAWSVLTTAAYMEMLNFHMFGPMFRDDDGTFVFAAPMGQGHTPMITLHDLGFFARYVFDHREQQSGKDLLVTSDLVSWPYLVSTFSKVTGQPARYANVPSDYWFEAFERPDRPLGREANPQELSGRVTWKENFTCWWANWREDVIAKERDMPYIRSIHPGLTSLEMWMRQVNYQAARKPTLKGPPSSDFNVELAKKMVKKWDDEQAALQKL